jgi:hypothetical protein
MCFIAMQYFSDAIYMPSKSMLMLFNVLTSKVNLFVVFKLNCKNFLAILHIYLRLRLLNLNFTVFMTSYKKETKSYK